jgi:hypothetical protein
MAKGQWYKNQTKEKARRAMLPMLVSELVGACPLPHFAYGIKPVYGIVVDWNLVQQYIETTEAEARPEWKTWIWAIWRPSRSDAVAAYEKAGERDLRPTKVGGKLTACDPDTYEFELIDQDGTERN